MKRWFLLTTFVLILTSCGNDDGGDLSPEPPLSSEEASLTILAYLIADNNLDLALRVNIGAMYDGLAEMQMPATLLVYWDGKTSMGKNSSTHLILKYQTDGRGNINGYPALDEDAYLDEILEMAEVVKEYPSQVSTDKAIMSQVLQDMVRMSPTERVGLVAGSHGSAWLNTISTVGRSFGQDGSVNNTILNVDFVEAMKSTGKTFDFLLFDACYMGTTEVCYDFREVVDYQIVSVMEVPAYGFPYDVLMKDLYAGTVEGYQQVCKSFIDYYQYIYDEEPIVPSWATVSLVDSKEMETLANQVKFQIVGNKEALVNFNVNDLQEYGRDSGKYIAFDLGQFIKKLNEGTMPNAFKTQLDKTILYKGCLEKARPTTYSVDVANYCGMGLYIPVNSRPKWNAWFKTLDWFTASGWNEVDFSWNF